MKKVIASIIFALSIGSANAFASNQFAMEGPYKKNPTPVFANSLVSTAMNIPSNFGKAVFDKLLQVSGVKGVHIVVADVPGSYTDHTHTVFIAKSDIALCERDLQCVAVIAAHEIGHNALGHTSGNEYDQKQMEKDADLYGVKLEAKAGFDPCAGVALFNKIGKLYGNDGGDDHPDNNVRAAYIQKACAAYKKLMDMWRGF